MKTGSTTTKDPTDDLLYSMDWNYPNQKGETFLNGATITASEWTQEDGDDALVLTDAGIADAATKAQVLISGGTEGVTYHVRNRVTFSGVPVQRPKRSFYLRIEKK
jgi:hypothetical protein